MIPGAPVFQKKYLSLIKITIIRQKKARDMDTIHIQLKVWTTRPSELLREVMRKPDLALTEVEELVKHSRFNGLFVIFFRLSEAQNDAMEGVAAHLRLRYERSQDSFLYDTRWYPNKDPYDQGAHDAEIDLWHFITLTYPRQYDLLDWENPEHSRRVQENAPQEALVNRVQGIRQVLDKLSAIPASSQSPEARKTIAHHEGYLHRVRQEFPSLASDHDN